MTPHRLHTSLGQQRLLPMLLTLALLALAGAARAQSNPGIFNLKGSDGYFAAYIDGSGNLALRGALVQNDQAIAATAAGEWIFRQSASVVLARISLAGSAVGELRLRGALYQNAAPQAAHPFRVKNNAGVVVASIDASGNLYLKGTSLAGASNPLQTTLDAPTRSFLLIPIQETVDRPSAALLPSLTGLGRFFGDPFPTLDSF